MLKSAKEILRDQRNLLNLGDSETGTKKFGIIDEIVSPENDLKVTVTSEKTTSEQGKDFSFPAESTDSADLEPRIESEVVEKMQQSPCASPVTSVLGHNCLVGTGVNSVKRNFEGISEGEKDAKRRKLDRDVVDGSGAERSSPNSSLSSPQLLPTSITTRSQSPPQTPPLALSLTE